MCIKRSLYSGLWKHQHFIAFCELQKFPCLLFCEFFPESNVSSHSLVWHLSKPWRESFLSRDFSWCAALSFLVLLLVNFRHLHMLVLLSVLIRTGEFGLELISCPGNCHQVVYFYSFSFFSISSGIIILCCQYLKIHFIYFVWFSMCLR